MEYIFKSKRLGFRRWYDSDLPQLVKMNLDEDVMKYFPDVYGIEKSEFFLKKMNHQLDERGYCYYAVDLLEETTFIGFIGLSFQTFEADFNPAVDIGWRLKKQFWRKGYATEGAQRCMNYAFEELKLDKVNSVAPKINLPSIGVMKKIGLEFQYDFEHPLLNGFPELKVCSLYCKRRTIN